MAGLTDESRKEAPPPPLRTGSGAAWWVTVTSTLSPVLLIGGWVVAGMLQPPSYSPVRQSISVLAGHGGADRWIMTGCLFAAGACHLITAAGLRGVRPLARVVLAAIGLAGIGIAAFPEPAHGSTWPHIAATIVGMALLSIWPAFVGSRRWANHPVLSIRGSSAVTGGFLVLLLWVIIETQGGDVLGVAERGVSGVEALWPIVVVLAVRRGTRQLSPARTIRLEQFRQRVATVRRRLLPD